MTKRDECTDGKITLAEFETWLEGVSRIGKRKNKIVRAQLIPQLYFCHSCFYGNK